MQLERFDFGLKTLQGGVGRHEFGEYDKAHSFRGEEGGGSQEDGQNIFVPELMLGNYKPTRRRIEKEGKGSGPALFIARRLLKANEFQQQQQQQQQH